MAHLQEITQKKSSPRDGETTDLALFVRTSNEDVNSWNRGKIVDALVVDHPVLGRLDTPENILANKLSALVDRQEPKDLADIWGFCSRLALSITLPHAVMIALPPTDSEREPQVPLPKGIAAVSPSTSAISSIGMPRWSAAT